MDFIVETDPRNNKSNSLTHCSDFRINSDSTWQPGAETMNINFRLLATFLAVAENASFRKAATETNRSLPAVSMQIKQLEEQLGVAVFQRTTRKVELTAEGEQLLISARKALAELEIGLSKLQQAADILVGKLSLACVPTVSGTRLPPVLTAFAARFPGITVSVRELPNQDLVEAVRRREVDFAIGTRPDRSNELDSAPLFTEPYCALLPEGFNHGGRQAMTLAQLAKGAPLLMLSHATAFREHVDQAAQAGGMSIQTNYEFMQVSTLVAMAETGLGIALLPRIAIPSQSKLRVVNLRPALSRTVAILTIRGHRLSPSAMRFTAMCRDLLPPDSGLGVKAKSVERLGSS